MSLRVWDERVVPRLTDLALRGDDVSELREVTCAGLTGRVLEIGFGSGLNVRWYPPEVRSVTAIEPSDLGWRLSERHRAGSDLVVERAGLDGQRLDLPDDFHDSALVTFSLCTIPDPLLALREARRVVATGDACTCSSTGWHPTSPYAVGSAGWSRCSAPSSPAAT
jgi:ubiquinone/menaquinone biosynthesis C-methylase UbiE